MATIWALSACDQPAATRVPLPEDAGAAIAALLQRWHGILRGELDRIIVELRASAADGARRKLDIDRTRMRVVTQGDGPKVIEVLLDDRAWRTRQGEATTALEDDERQALVDLRLLVTGAYLAPLYGARSISRRGPTVFAVEAGDGTTWRFEIDAARQMPVSISGPAGTVRFLSFLSTGVSDLPAEVELGALGKQHLTLIARGVAFEPGLFREATDAASGAARRAPTPWRVTTGEPSKPEVMELPARPFLVIEDPGDWATRAARIVASYATLTEQGQREEGLPFLCEVDGKPTIGIPFAPDEERGGHAIVARQDQVIRHRPQEFAIVLYRGKQAFAPSRVAGERDVRNYLDQTKAVATGCLRVIPHFDWHRGEPSAAALAAVKLRFELPIEKPRK